MVLDMTKLNKGNGFFHRRTNAVDVETAKIPSDYNRRTAGSCVAVSPDKAEQSGPACSVPWRLREC